jgi:DNA-binding CsgD family transcriptional regulator
MSTTTAGVEHHVRALSESRARAQSSNDLFGWASERLRQIVPFDGAGWFATDPVTVLATTPIRIENIEAGHCESFWERECLVEDAILFRDLARSDTGVGTLYQATHDQPARSARYREFLAPQGYGDELRAAFRTGSSTWGVLDLYRDRGRGAFTPLEVSLVQAILPAVAVALRAFAVGSEVIPAPSAVDGPGTALFDPHGRLLSLDDRAEKLFAELAGPNWSAAPPTMTPVIAVVARAAAVLEGRDRGPASARLRSSSGRWLAVHASCLRQPDGGPGPTALTIEPAKSAQIAPIIVEAYCLTVREQEITRLVARGLSNPEIAAELFLSPHTVRDHLKAIFGKVGVGSRGELVAKLFAEHYAPALHQPGAAVSHTEY